MTGGPQVVVLTPEVPHREVPHAGGRYVATLVGLLADEGAQVTVLVPDTPVNRSAPRTGLPGDAYVLGDRGRRPRWRRALFRALAVADARRLRRDPACTSLVLVGELLTTPVARAALRRADVVDLQYAEMARLERLVRRLAPGARLVGTFHDVRTERFRRLAARAADPAARTALERAERNEAAVQRRLVERLDTTITFSPKDAAQLHREGSTRVRVIPPPLGDGRRPPRHRAAAPTLLFVGHLARPENQEALTWFLDTVWPHLRAISPDVVLRVVGGGTPDALRARLARDAGVEPLGYVPDLSAEYARAWLAVVPLHDGAGVKFKTIEAVVAAVPVVTTPIGAEGVAEEHRFAGCSDDPDEFARACEGVLSDPVAADAAASTLAKWAGTHFSVDALRTAAREVYLGR